MLGHYIIFEKIMFMVFCLDSYYESLDCCRQVCKTWNTMIMNMIFENPTKKWGTIIQRRIVRFGLLREWDYFQDYYPSDKQISRAKILETGGIITVFKSLTKRVEERIGFPKELSVITCAASLAHHGLLGDIAWMMLRDVDLSSVPADHLASLASRVTECVGIQNVRGLKMDTFLDSVKSKELYIQSLDSEETQALVRAMESRVERVVLNKWLTLDIGDLLGYNGQGKCKRVECYNDVVARYRVQLVNWARSINWEVSCNSENFQHFKIERMQNSGNTIQYK